MSVQPAGTRWYNAVWRWHFYAGMLCVPFVLWLALTGATYAWRPQIEAWLDAPYHRLTPMGEAAKPSEIVRLAQAAAPGLALARYQLPRDARSAAEVVLGTRGNERRVFVDPYRRRVMDVQTEAWRPMIVLFHLHGELMAGAWGSYLVELAACWAIVMILTGLYLWWPRGRKGLAGVLWPRLRGGGRVFWRDLHATTGLWASTLALFLIVTGLPWAKAWGGYLTTIRVAAGATDAPSWTMGGKPADDPHADHRGMAGMAGMPAMQAPPAAVIDRMVATAATANLPAPAIVSAPSRRRPGWTATTESHDRTMWRELTFDPATGAVTGTRVFAQRHWIDRLVGYGATIHEGALFGIANQLLSTLAALLLALLAATGAILWWRRRPAGLIGAPLPLRRPRFGPVLIGGIVLLAAAMPLFGLSLVAVLLAERLVLRRWAPTARWLGLARLHQTAAAHHIEA